MGGSFKILRVFGIDVKIHWTFFLLFVFFGGYGYLQSGTVLGAVFMTALILVLFVFVLLHEFGHALVAIRQGIEVPDITLLPIGGLARLKTIPERPWDEVKIAVAGPIVNVILAALFYGVALLFFGVSPFTLPSPEVIAEGTSSAGIILSYLGLMNVILGVFNMIPAFPMDGGRILRGLLATRFGPVRATDISSTVGQFFAFAFFVFGLLSGNFLLALIAVFIFFGAGGEAQMVRQRELMRGLTVADVMGTKRRTETLTPYHNFGQVLDAVVHGYQEDFPIVEEDGRLVGMITRDEIMKAAHSSDKFLNVRDLMRTEFPTISPGADLFTEGYQTLQENNIRAVPVVDEYGDLTGMLTIDDIRQASLLRQLPK
jgi:Zn-dependent protease